MFLTYRNIFKGAVPALVLLGLAFVYRLYDPLLTDFFPSCPFLYATGLECPGCGSQRALHHLLNLQFSAAYQQNTLLVLSIPYLMTGFIFEKVLNPTDKVLKWRKLLFGRRAILVVLTVIILHWVFRNLP